MPTDDRRRQDDCVSWREMVDFVSQSDAQFHTIRAESLIVISNTLEKIESRFDKHEEWHRNVLEQVISNGSQNRVAMASVTVAVLALMVTIVFGIITFLR